MNTTLFISSFLAGLLTALTPCVLPLLPVLIGSTAASSNPKKPWIVTLSLGLSIVLFTLLLKASVFFIDVPEVFWTTLCGGIVFVYGVFLLFPSLWDVLSLKLGLGRNAQSWLLKASSADSLWGAILVGAALGPVFTSCSPTYLLILATVLPAHFIAGLLYLLIYVFGLMLVLGLIAYFGQRMIMRLKWASHPEGLFKRSMGALLVLVGLLVASDSTKSIEASLLNSGYDPSKIEQQWLGNPSGALNKPLAQNKSEHYQEYSAKKVALAQSKGQPYALFFHATWCPTCQALEKTIIEHSDKLPNQSLIFKVDYDSSPELKKQLQVLTQSTVVFFNDKGQVSDRKVNPTFDRIVQGLSGKTTLPSQSFLNPKLGQALQQLKSAKSTFPTAQAYFTFLQKDKSLEQATFAGGCFWCLEGPFEAEEGVVEAFSGYAGGTFEHPTYEEVSSGKTNAREAVDVFYNPKAISYSKLLEVYWRQIDPTDAAGQFADQGLQYTTAIFYRNEEQKKSAQASKKKLEESGQFVQVATQILPFERFHLAEEYHQDYYLKSADEYHRYKMGSGREKTIQQNSGSFDAIFKPKPYTKPNSEKIKSMLNQNAYAVTQEGATEKPFDNAYWDNHAPGIYVDVVTGEPLFSSTDQFDSGTGWPSFTRPIDDHFIQEQEDTTLVVPRTEVKSKIGDSHLGHVFHDGPKDKGGMRYCINSAALRFIPVDKMKEQGYGHYLFLFHSSSNNH
jgi:peptide methionine sulfoxide reductase msrA/msrB